MTSKRSYLYLGGERNNSSISLDTQFDFDEADLWESSEHVVPEIKQYQKSNPIPLKKSSRRSQKTAGSGMDRQSKSSMSLPVNVPDWSKILRDEYKENRDSYEVDVDDDDLDEDDRIPPHEYLLRTRMASLSVHEGVGRTLKGRDLSRVRNAIWKQTGFED